MTRNYVEKNLSKLKEQGLVRESLRLWAVRNMLEHRGIDRDAIAKVSGMSKSRVSTALSGAAYLSADLNGDKLLDRIEDAITRICDDRGYTCKCSDEAFADLTELLRG